MDVYLTAVDNPIRFDPNYKKIQIYLEHFGIDKNNNVPKWFEGETYEEARQNYLEGMEWKRKSTSKK